MSRRYVYRRPFRHRPPREVKPLHILMYPAGGIALTPDPVAIPIVIPTPTLAVDRLVTPDPVVVPIVIPTPTVVIDIDLAPDPVAVPLVIPTPTLTFTLTPDPVAVPIVIPTPTLTLGIGLTPDPVAIPVVVPTPTLTMGLTPDPVVVPVVIPDPVVSVGTPLTYDAFAWGDMAGQIFGTAGSRVACADDTAASADTLRATSEVFDAVVTNGYAAGLGNSATADTVDAASFFEMLRIGGTLAEAVMVAVAKVDYTSVSVGFGGFTVGFEQGGYNLYRALTREAVLDGNPVAYARPGATELSVAQADETAFWYGITAVSSAGVENRARMRIVRESVSGGILGGPRPNPVAWARARAVEGGQIELSYEYDGGGAAGVATGLQVGRATGHDGAGVDWGALIQTITISGRAHGKTTLAPTYADGETVYLAVRAVTAAGDSGTVLEPGGSPVIADSSGPVANPVLVGSQG